MPLRKKISSKRELIRNILGVALPICFAAFTIFYISGYDVVLKASIGDESCGYVVSRSGFDNARSALEAELSKDIGEYSLDSCDVTYSIEYVRAPEFLSDDECAEMLYEAVSAEYRVANMLYVDGVMTAANDDEIELEELISEIEDELLESAGERYDRVELSSKLTIEEQYCPVEYIMPIDEINSMINPLAEDETVRVSAFSSLAPSVAAFSMRSVVEEDVSALEYYLVSTETIDETVSYTTEYIDDPNHFEGWEMLIQEGSDGFRTVTYEISSDPNGEEISRKELSETIHVEVVNEIIQRGSKPIPPTGATGTYIWPCEVKEGLSSGYGSRDLFGSYDFHLGIDIPGDKGDEIYASDGGEVIWAGFTPSYGNSVRIQHDDHTMTLYAHMSKLDVEVGDMVYQGQLIGEMGRTGAASGVHLHFEVRIDSKTTDPMKYLPDLKEEELGDTEQILAIQAWEARKFSK